MTGNTPFLNTIPPTRETHSDTFTYIFFIANTAIFPSSIPFLLNMALYHHTHLFFPSLVLLTYFCLIHNHVYDGIGGTVTLKVTQLITILYSMHTAILLVK